MELARFKLTLEMSPNRRGCLDSTIATVPDDPSIEPTIWLDDTEQHEVPYAVMCWFMRHVADEGPQ